jgi:hypothetical protein
MSKTITKKTQLKSVRFPHLIIEGFEEQLNDSRSFTDWIQEAAKEKLLKDDNYNVDEIIQEHKRAKQREKFLLNEEAKNKKKLIKIQKKQAKLNLSS